MAKTVTTSNVARTEMGHFEVVRWRTCEGKLFTIYDGPESEWVLCSEEEHEEMLGEENQVWHLGVVTQKAWDKYQKVVSESAPHVRPHDVLDAATKLISKTRELTF